ncbi:MAG: TonB-dependent receptor plug domain-containing protein [Balneolaceae bacterium]|nr:TonB-dependent receptor plug domain-containing protein [Balneolaceae bacterium]
MKSTIRKFLPKSCSLFILIFAVFWNSNAQTAENDTLSIELDEIRIEATHSSVTIGRAPLSVSYVTRSEADITARPAATMDELTFTLPGVWISNRENHALGERMTVRGMGWRSQFGVRGIQVILDDIPLTVADGQSVMNMVDPAMVQSLELLRGPSATFWGNSSGGVLYMRTQPPADSPKLFYRGYMGSFNTMKQELRWHDNIGGVRWNAYGSYFDTDGYRDYSAAQLIRGGISAGFEPGENSSAVVRLTYSGMPFAEHPGSLSREDAEENPSMAWPFNENVRAGKEFHQMMGSARYIHNFESGLLSVLAHGTYRDLTNPLPGPYITVDRLAGGTRTTYDFNDLPFSLQVGGEMNWQHDDRQQFNNQQGSRGDEIIINQIDNVRSQALFAKAVFDLNRLSVSLGLRGDRMVFSVDDFIENDESSRTFTTMNPSVGLNYNFGNTRWFANFSSSFESPTTTEFKNRLGPDGNLLPGFNPDLNPERALGFESGFRGLYPALNLEFDITGFAQFVSNQIIQEQEIDGQAIFSNGGDAEHFGIETHFRFHPVEFLSLELMYTWINAQFSGGEYDMGSTFEGNKLPGVAPHRFGSVLSLHAGSHTISADTEWISEYFADSANEAVNDSYLLLNSRWSFTVLNAGNWKIQPFVAVSNILNTRYNTSVAINNAFGRYFEPGSVRSIRAGLRMDLF